jgi:hypothetical protein
MASSVNAFISSDYFQQMSDLSLTVDEISNLEIIIDSVMDIFEQFCSRKLKARDFSSDDTSSDYDFEYTIFDPPNKNTLWLPTYPVNSITSITVNDELIIPSTDYSDSTGYFLYPHKGQIYYSNGFSFGYKQNIKIDWNGGYNDNHKSYKTLQQLNYLVVKKLWDDNAGDVNPELLSESIGNYRYTKMSPKDMSSLFGLPLFVFVNLGRFKKGVIG